jgi:nucleoside phosphorylase
LVVGICGVVPFYEDGHSKRQIWLGDIIISTAVVQYDFGRQYPGRFVRKSALEDSLASEPRDQTAGVATENLPLSG